MPTTHILIDCENVPPSNLSLANIDGVSVYVFLGPNNTKLDTGFAVAIQELGHRAKYVQLEKSGKNALDFHIAFYLGKLACMYPLDRFRVISRDKEFGTLIDHLKSEKVDADCSVSIEQAIDPNFVSKPIQPRKLPRPQNVKQELQSVARKSPATPVAMSQAKAKPKAKQAKNYGGMKTKELAELAWAKLVNRKKAKPSTLSKLTSSLNADFSKQLDEKKVKAVVQQLIKDGHVEIDGETVSYK
jgi:PIN domain